MRDFFIAQFETASLRGCLIVEVHKNIKINHLHEIAPRLIYDDYELTFEELLERNGSFTIHHYNIQVLCVELYIIICFQWVLGKVKNVLKQPKTI